MTAKCIIDCFPESASRYRSDYAIIAVDVIRATTTATIAVSLKRRVHIVQNTDKAFILAEKLAKPILAGELGGNVPYGFDMTNSPFLVAALSTIETGAFASPERDIILLSSSGTQLILNSEGCQGTYLGCFRNFSAVAKHAAARHEKIAIIGAGTRGAFRREDQMGCAWIAQKLLTMGFEPENTDTTDIIQQWSDTSPDEIRNGRSADYLRRTGQTYDLEYIINHIDDLDVVPVILEGLAFNANDR